ncbi:hypothetical protein, partial [Epibacterium ulvae]
FQLPDDLGPGIYYAYAHVDAGNKFAETDETNNFADPFKIIIGGEEHIAELQSPSAPVTTSPNSSLYDIDIGEDHADAFVFDQWL